MTDNITMPREVVEKIHEAWSSEVYPPAASTEWYDIMDALRTALAAEPTKPEPVAWQERHLFPGMGEWTNWYDHQRPRLAHHPLEEVHDRVRYQFRPLYAAPPSTHPGYVIGSHWLETAYSRVCAGEAEADVLRDIGLVREEAFLTGVAHLKAENEALRRDAERLREALAWAYNLRHLRGHSDPVVIPERFAPLIEDALRREETT